MFSRIFNFVFFILLTIISWNNLQNPSDPIDVYIFTFCIIMFVLMAIRYFVLFFYPKIKISNTTLSIELLPIWVKTFDLSNIKIIPFKSGLLKMIRISDNSNKMYFVKSDFTKKQIEMLQNIQKF